MAQINVLIGVGKCYNSAFSLMVLPIRIDIHDPASLVTVVSGLEAMLEWEPEWVKWFLNLSIQTQF